MNIEKNKISDVNDKCALSKCNTYYLKGNEIIHTETVGEVVKFNKILKVLNSFDNRIENVKESKLIRHLVRLT